MSQDIRVLFEDEWVVAFDKPPDLTVTRADSVKVETLEDYLIATFEWAQTIERGGIVHRLDKDTSGIILVAKTAEAILAFQKLFHDRLIQKRYTTLVHGAFSVAEGHIDGAIGRNPKNREKFTVMVDGREAVTDYRVVEQLTIDPMQLTQERERVTKKEKQYFLEHASKYSLVYCFPHTGRTHQIRVHMQHLGHPLVSDEVYTNKKLCRLDQTWCPRHFLHASELTFVHPYTGKEMRVESELPGDLSKAWMGIQESSKLQT